MRQSPGAGTLQLTIDDSRFTFHDSTAHYLLITHNSSHMSFEKTYLDSVIKRFKEYKGLGEKTFAQLKDDEMNMQPNAESNSIGIIIQHLNGNMVSRWTNFLTEDGEKESRNRDEEFEEQHFSKNELLDKWTEGWKVFMDTLESLKEG